MPAHPARVCRHLAASFCVYFVPRYAAMCRFSPLRRTSPIWLSPVSEAGDLGSIPSARTSFLSGSERKLSSEANARSRNGRRGPAWRRRTLPLVPSTSQDHAQASRERLPSEAGSEGGHFMQRGTKPRLHQKPQGETVRRLVRRSFSEGGSLGEGGHCPRPDNRRTATPADCGEVPRLHQRLSPQAKNGFPKLALRRRSSPLQKHATRSHLR
jgi:hypothetical protein